ncbi:MAG: site-specific DNA-methyltransferase [Gammaproteobacteria bacterium]|nr:site-specific DNA-methyltransferase [Gammaproteobacteria bacterium]
MNSTAKENRFLDALESLFTGADVEGESGFINLMRMKRGYFKSLRPKLMEKIDSRAGKHTAFREELFDKLYTFFSRYFCESGSIYYRHLPAFAKIYERVYTGDEDVALSWKTRMLYYVKSDILVRSMPVTLEGKYNPIQRKLFYFDASQVEHKRNNERREFVFEFANTEQTPEGNVVRLTVTYSRKGRKTNLETIIKKAKNAPGPKVTLNEDDLQQAIRVFKRQTEADFFINKDARGFLREQFDLWLYQYMFQEETIFEQQRLSQLQAIQQTAYDIIDFIAQFEDELRRAWEKPKFVRNVNYVVTLDKLPSELLAKIATHKGASAQVEEWQELGLVDESFSMADLNKGQGELSLADNGPANSAYRFLPLDTAHFKELEQDVLDSLGNLDEALDGELIHSENWQALNTLRKRYEGRVKCIHIDPPYNTKTSGFLYRNEYKHSSWLTMMENRASVALGLLSEEGSYLCHIDENECERLQLLLEATGLLNAGAVVWDKKNPMMGSKGVSTQHEYVLWRTNNEGSFYLQGAHVKTILAEADELIKKHGGVNDAACEEFSRWVENNKDFTGGERSYKFLNDDGRVYQSVGMGAPELRTDEKFHTSILHPITKMPCQSPKNGWSRTPDNIEKLIAKGEIIFGSDHTVQPRRKIFLSETTKRAISTVIQDGKRGRTDINNLGLEFPYCHPVSLYERLIDAALLNEDGVVLDYFAGSGTSAHATINLNREDEEGRKYVLIEMGDYFHTVLLPRIKKIVYSKDWKEGKPKSSEGVSHFLKYYTLEQYEETPRNSRYKDSEQLELDSQKSPFEQYVFFSDDKLAHAVQPTKNDTLDINLQDLYPDIDLAESLSNALGKPIRHRSADNVTFADGTTEKTNPASMTEEEKSHFISVLKNYLWWGR